MKAVAQFVTPHIAMAASSQRPCHQQPSPHCPLPLSPVREQWLFPQAIRRKLSKQSFALSVGSKPPNSSGLRRVNPILLRP